MATQRVTATGFTLIELLVVMVILTIATTFAVLAISFQSDERVLREHSRYAAELLRYAHQRAVLQGKLLGTLVQPSQLGFYQFQVAADDTLSSGAWHHIGQDTLLRDRRWPKAITTDLLVKGASVTAMQADEGVTPQIVFSTSGEQTPFELRFARRGHGAEYVVVGNTNGTVTWQEMASH